MLRYLWSTVSRYNTGSVYRYIAISIYVLQIPTLKDNLRCHFSNSTAINRDSSTGCV